MGKENEKEKSLLERWRVKIFGSKEMQLEVIADSNGRTRKDFMSEEELREERKRKRPPSGLLVPKGQPKRGSVFGSKSYDSIASSKYSEGEEHDQETQGSEALGDGFDEYRKKEEFFSCLNELDAYVLPEKQSKATSSVRDDYKDITTPEDSTTHNTRKKKGSTMGLFKSFKIGKFFSSRRRKPQKRKRDSLSELLPDPETLRKHGSYLDSLNNFKSPTSNEVAAPIDVSSNKPHLQKNKSRKDNKKEKRDAKRSFASFAGDSGTGQYPKGLIAELIVVQNRSKTSDSTTKEGAVKASSSPTGKRRKKKGRKSRRSTIT